MANNIQNLIDSNTKIRYSIGKKIGASVVFFSMIFFILVVLLSGFVDSRFTLNAIVKRNYSLARSLAISLDRDYVTSLFNKTREIEKEASLKYKDNVNTPEYLSEFDSLKTDEYKNLVDSLSDVVKENSILWINLHLENPETGKTCFILDTDEQPNGQYSAGWQSHIRDYNYARGLPYEVIMDAADGYIIMTEAPYYKPGSDKKEVIGYIAIAEARKNLSRNSKNFMLIFGLSMSVLSLTFVLLSVWGIHKIVVNPIVKLAVAAKAFGEKEDKRSESHIFRDVDIHSEDEIRVLSDSMTRMEKDIYTYIRDLEQITRKQERLNVELDVASRIQTNMLPDELTGYNGPKDFEIAATMRAAREVGGDFYDYFTIDDDHIGLIIADVSDKGVPASMLMVVTKVLFKNTSMDSLSPLEITSKVNRQLSEYNKEMQFVTVFFGIYTVSERTLRYVNAGHEDPVIFKNDKKEYKLIIEEHDLVLGIMEDTDFTERELKFDTGDLLFLYTDGVPDATSENGDALGIERMMEILMNHRDLTGLELLEAVRDDADRFAGSADQFDDMTMLCLSVPEK